MVGQAVGAGIGEAMDGLLGNPVAEKIVTGTLAGMASGATVTAMRGGRVNAAQIAADAFGNALGQGLVDEMQSGVDWSKAPDQSDAETARLQRYEKAASEAEYMQQSDAILGRKSYEAQERDNVAHAQRFLDSRPIADASDWANVGWNAMPQTATDTGSASPFWGDKPFFDDTPRADTGPRPGDPMPGSNRDQAKQATYERFQSFAQDMAARKAAMQSADSLQMTGMDKAHLLLDGINLVADGPFAPIGAVAGLIDAGLYLYEGQKLDAGLSLASTIPLLGTSLPATRSAVRVGDEMASGVLATRVAELQLEGHALARHGGAVTDEDLIRRAYTGVASDGSVLPRGRTPDSTAFFNDDLLVKADDFLRKNALDDAIQNAAPGQLRLKVSGDMGTSVGRGYLPVGKVTGLDGPLLRIDNITRVEGWYVYSPTRGVWETNTVYPLARP
jgi:hypothetical protein